MQEINTIQETSALINDYISQELADRKNFLNTIIGKQNINSFQENGPYGNLPLPITNQKQEKTTIDLNITHSPTGQKKTISLPIGGMVSTIFNLGKATAATINGQSTQ